MHVLKLRLRRVLVAEAGRRGAGAWRRGGAVEAGLRRRPLVMLRRLRVALAATRVAAAVTAVFTTQGGCCCCGGGSVDGAVRRVVVVGRRRRRPRRYHRCRRRCWRRRCWCSWLRGRCRCRLWGPGMCHSGRRWRSSRRWRKSCGALTQAPVSISIRIDALAYPHRPSPLHTAAMQHRCCPC